MAELIDCPACERQVSNMAPACPQCGQPIAQPSNSPESDGQRVTTQLTAKSLKAQQLAAAILVVVGFVMTLGEAPAVISSLLLTIGLIWFVVARFMTWWRHG